MKIADLITEKIFSIAGNSFDDERKNRLFADIDKLKPDYTESKEVNYLSFETQNKRMKTKIGRFLSTKLELNHGFLSDAVLRSIAESICVEMFGGNACTVNLCTGKDITENYRKAVGSRSCMTGGYANYTKLYEQNPDRFQMATCFVGNDSARAIVAKLDNGNYFMDRIYSSSDATYQTLLDYAIASGWYYKDKHYLYLDGSNAGTSNVKVSCLSYCDDAIPYMDTLKYAKIRDGKMDLSANGANYDYLLERTDGHLEEVLHCANCDCEIDRDNSYCTPNGDDYCEGCYSEHCIYCDDCQETRWEEDSISVGNRTICSSCADDYTKCEGCDRYIHNDKTVEVDGNYYCEYCYSDNFGRCEDCEESFENDDLIEHNNRYYCEDCLDEMLNVCDECGKHLSNDELAENDNNKRFCADCADIIQKEGRFNVRQLLMF